MEVRRLRPGERRREAARSARRRRERSAGERCLEFIATLAVDQWQLVCDPDVHSPREWRDVAHSTEDAQGVSLRPMETHAFKDPADPTKGGVWSGEYGIRICTWAWSSSTKVLEVRCGPRGNSRDLSGIDLSTVDLSERLPDIALEMADLIAQGK